MGIRLENVGKKFANKWVVNEVSFEAHKGITGFLGPNGAGKSTTMRMITGYLEPDNGRVFIDDEDVWPTKKSIRDKIGYLPEHNPLYTDMYVKEYLSFICSMRKVSNPKAAIAKVIEEVGLQREQHKKIGQLSKGYRQRVGLAQAIIHNPKVLILDEPTSGLDPNQLSEIRGLIKKLGEDKVVLLSTHIMQEVQALCSRVLILDTGTLVADDKIDQIRTQQRKLSYVRLVTQKSIDLQAFEEIEGVLDVQENRGELVLSYDAAVDLRPEIAAFVVNNGLGLLEMRLDQQSLEEVFQTITSKKKS